ncbi:MAG TPA: hypothetical protein PLK06_00060 [bacterium]|nr:hypothetical protein [bacterium]
MRRLVAGIVIGIVIMPIVWIYVSSRWAYDPERACAQQKDVSREACLANIRFVEAAGW